MDFPCCGELYCNRKFTPSVTPVDFSCRLRVFEPLEIKSFSRYPSYLTSVRHYSKSLVRKKGFPLGTTTWASVWIQSDCRKEFLSEKISFVVWFFCHWAHDKSCFGTEYNRSGYSPWVSSNFITIARSNADTIDSCWVPELRNCNSLSFSSFRSYAWGWGSIEFVCYFCLNRIRNFMLYFLKLALLPQSLNIFRPLISMYVLNITSGDRLENTVGEFLY